jgi:hypothetical protein
LVLTSNAERAEAIDTLKRVKEQRVAVVEFFRDMKAKAHMAWKAITEKESGYLGVLDQVERTVKGVVLSYDQEQEAARVAEEQRLQAEADAKAEAERARLLREAARTKNPALKEAKLEQAEAVVAPTVSVAPTIERQAGESTRTTWKARVLNPMIVPRKWLVVDEKKLNAYARETEGKETVPGVEFYPDQTLGIAI